MLNGKHHAIELIKNWIGLSAHFKLELQMASERLEQKKTDPNGCSKQRQAVGFQQLCTTRQAAKSDCTLHTWIISKTYLFINHTA